MLDFEAWNIQLSIKTPRLQTWKNGLSSVFVEFISCVIGYQLCFVVVWMEILILLHCFQQRLLPPSVSSWRVLPLNSVIVLSTCFSSCGWCYYDCNIFFRYPIQCFFFCLNQKYINTECWISTSINGSKCSGIQDATVCVILIQCNLPVAFTNSRAHALPVLLHGLSWATLVSVQKTSSGWWHTHNLKVKYKY